MSLRKQFISGTIYIAVTKYSSILIGLVIMAILSRLLTPDDFGTVAIVSVLVVFFGLLGELGIGPAIIQKKELSKQDINVIFSFTILVGLTLAIVFFSLSPLVSSFYKQPVLKNICQLFSITILFACTNIVPNALLLKEKNFKFLMFRQLSIQLICGTLGIFAALMDWGIYALLIHSMSSTILTFSVNYLHRPIKIASINILSLKKIARFSIYQFLFGFINYFSRNLDKLLIGKFLSPAALGYYEKSYRLMLMPVDNLTNVLTPVIQPFFSDFQDDKQRIYNAYLKIVKLLALIGLPLSVFVHFSAKELILLIFGDQWIASIPVFEILAWSIGIQVILSSSGSIFQAANDTKRLFFAGLLTTSIMVSAILIAVFLFNNLEAIAYFLLIAFGLNFFSAYYILIKKALRQSIIPFFKQLFVPVLLAISVFALEFLFSRYVEINNLYLSLGLKTGIFCIVFLPVVIINKNFTALLHNN
ncbi:MAG: lipopolysaccharide biosynthesis protein [Dysgonamonadaceae bacterium]|jgi:PST family polysaccharide transporter|nr:lipopolysaccharide biosynthesis protein [Dysgonamonadaceae bacterium]